jgi:hypothetical protein
MRTAPTSDAFHAVIRPTSMFEYLYERSVSFERIAQPVTSSESRGRRDTDEDAIANGEATHPNALDFAPNEAMLPSVGKERDAVVVDLDARRSMQRAEAQSDGDRDGDGKRASERPERARREKSGEDRQQKDIFRRRRGRPPPSRVDVAPRHAFTLCPYRAVGSRSFARRLRSRRPSETRACVRAVCPWRRRPRWWRR